MTTPQPGDHVRVVVRSFLYCNPRESPIEWTGSVAEVAAHGIWIAPDGENWEEFIAFCEVEDVQLL
ncbi:hypothetical protein [Alicyclobacillus fodiniaquatilis]|uniref:Uncharacterized protein n=1 Tax=Alicyclobacillus fodiniaquatilis TaxID=1661150 RepID=A0ABW4JF36_9BACL